MAHLDLIDVCKVYKGNVKAVKDFNLEIKDGEFLVFVGPSGCGKSTTLRMIAGLEDITSGKIFIDDKLINHLEPKDRDIAMVFQNYALYPHMSVYENLAYSLNCHHVNKAVIKEKVEEVSKMLGIEEYLQRKPKELSGGQRQRVALGRCLIRSPKVFLFDEPLSNLDAKLRVSMRSEISKLHKRVNGTFIYVTHDQTEAMTMGDRIVVMKDGLIQQVDTPVNLYEHPVNVFVATFLGSPQMNIINAHLKGNKIYIGDSKTLDLTEKVINKIIDGNDDSDIYLGIRPSDFTLGNKDDYDIEIDKVDLIEKLGNETLIYFSMEGKKESALASLKLSITDDIDGKIYLKIDKDKLHLFNLNEESILRTNETNFIQSTFKLDGNDLIINDKFKYSHYVEKCVDDNYLGNFDGLISIPSKEFTTEKINDDDYELEVEVRVVDIFSDKKVCYARILEDQNTRITFFVNRESKLSKGDKLKIYASMDKINIYTKELDRITVDDSINKPIIDVDLVQIGIEYYIKSKDKAFCKNKYFVIEKIFDLNRKMVLNVKNNKDEKFSFRIQKDSNLYIGLEIYLKHVK